MIKTYTKIKVEYDPEEHYYIVGVLLIKEFHKQMGDIAEELSNLSQEQNYEYLKAPSVEISPEMFSETRYDFQITNPFIHRRIPHCPQA